MIAHNARSIYPAPFPAATIPTCEFIPPITDPMGRSWRQPDMTEVEVNGTHVLLTKAQFDALPEYSTSYPSGVYPGKCWKAEEIVPVYRDGVPCGHRGTGVWFLRWFGLCEDANKCSNNQREIIILN